MSLLRAVATVSGFTMMSRITGFARDILIASILGAGPIADAFFIAFKFPNFFRRLTAEGAFTVAFVPTFSRLLQDKGRKDALEFAEEVISIMGIGLFLFSFFVIIFMPTVMLGLAPGFIERDWLFDLTVELARITFIYLTPISLVALLGGILNSFGKFGAMASAPILLNIILIVSLVFFENSMETKGHVLAIAVAISGVAQFIWLLEACRQNGSIPKLRRPRVTERVKKLFKLMLPAVLGAGVVQINLLIDIILASTLPSGSISFLYFADRINQLPLALIGIAIGTALLPKLSREIQCGELEKAKRSQDQALEFGMVLALPAAVGLLVLSQPIISTLFERGAFSPTAVDATAQTLFCYALGLPAFIIIKVLQPSFFARYDTLTPVKVARVRSLKRQFTVSPTLGMNSFADLPLQRTVVPKAFSASSMNPLVRLSPRTTGVLVPEEVDSVSKTGSSGEEHPKKRRRAKKRRKVGMNFFMGVTINRIMNS